MRDSMDPAVMRETIQKQSERIKQLEVLLLRIPQVLTVLRNAEAAIHEAVATVEGLQPT